MSRSNPCPGSSRYIAHQERVVCGALGESIKYALCGDCGQRVLIGPDDRLIRHRPAAVRVPMLRVRDEPSAASVVRLVAGRRAS